MTKSGFKPCPFCGNAEVKVMIAPEPFAGMRHIIAYCGDRRCRASVYVSVKDQQLVQTTAADLVADKWNRRKRG